MKFKLITAGLLAASLNGFAADEHAHFTYSGETGPSHWGDLDKDNAACNLGKEQSPIDIAGAKAADLPPIAFEYRDSLGEIVNNGHTVQVNLTAGGTIQVGGVEYKLVQFHFHTPSEEKINGKAHVLVAHLVHRTAEGKLAVVAILFDAGSENAALKPVFGAMPAKASEAHPLAAPINAGTFLPAKRGYYTFMGSLTTPPCSEGVRWLVLKEPQQISKDELGAFKKLYAMNARPTQPLNGRTLEESR